VLTAQLLPTVIDGQAGTFFSVWAPNAERVAVMGDFNGWNQTSHPLRPKESSGIWEGVILSLGRHSKTEDEGGGINPCVVCRDRRAGIRLAFNDPSSPSNHQKKDK